jgi:polysaccharide pyruvyl transferase WcaK-like protein
MSEWKVLLEGRCQACKGTGTVREPKSGRVLDCRARGCEAGVLREKFSLAELKAMLFAAK